jgi:hypothetical protein
MLLEHEAIKSEHLISNSLISLVAIVEILSRRHPCLGLTADCPLGPYTWTVSLYNC